MKSNSVFSIITESFDQLFIVDKHERTIFFPWGDEKQGYYIQNKNVVAKTKFFYKTSFYIFLFILIIMLSFLGKTFWGISGSVVVCLGGWYLTYFLYVSKIIKSLPSVKESYKELVLEKFETANSEDEDVKYSTVTQFTAHRNKPIFKTTSDPFLRIKTIFYRLSPDQLFVSYFFIGIGIIMIWTNFNDNSFGESPIDYLVACFVCILWGLAGFVSAKNMEIENKDWWNFLNWKLPMILMAIVFWSLAVVSLYKFFVMIIV